MSKKRGVSLLTLTVRHPVDLTRSDTKGSFAKGSNYIKEKNKMINNLGISLLSVTQL